MKFEVGQRVKVVDDSAIPPVVGAIGVIEETWEYNPQPHHVKLDPPIRGVKVRWFGEDELTPVNVTTIEGVVDWTKIGDEDIPLLLAPHHGKRVKLTLEVIE
jgi:hypothetical protein